MDRKGCEEKHPHTTAHHPVVKPPAVVSTAVSHTPTQQQGWGNYQELSCSLSPMEATISIVCVCAYVRGYFTHGGRESNVDGRDVELDVVYMFVVEALTHKGCEEKHPHTRARHPVVKPPAVVFTAVSHIPTQQQGWGNYQELSWSLSTALLYRRRHRENGKIGLRVNPDSRS